MHDTVPSCFRGGAAGAPPASTAAGPSLATSVYETHLGLAGLSWSRTVLGLSLRLDLRLDGEDEPLRFRARPWLFWKRRGSRRFQITDHPRHRLLNLHWDLSRARFPSTGGPEPVSHFFVAVVLDGEMLLVAGDLSDEAYRKTKARKPGKELAAPALISRREHVALRDAGGGARAYTTQARVGGREREVKVELGARGSGGGGSGREREAGLWVALDGERVLHVRRVRWKFRGSEIVEAEGGERVQISWDLHGWLFPSSKDQPPPAAATSEFGRAVFVFRFEDPEGHSGKERDSFSGEVKGVYKGLGGYFGKTRNWSESSSGGGGGGERKRGKRKSLLKTSSSSSSTSSASSGSSSTVMEWASQEEAQLRSAEGFSLLVYAWKS